MNKITIAACKRHNACFDLAGAVRLYHKHLAVPGAGTSVLLPGGDWLRLDDGAPELRDDASEVAQ